MPRSVDDVQLNNGKAQFIAVLEVVVWVGYSCLLVDVDFCAGAAGKLPVALYIGGVVLGFDYRCHFEAPWGCYFYNFVFHFQARGHSSPSPPPCVPTHITLPPPPL